MKRTYTLFTLLILFNILSTTLVAQKYTKTQIEEMLINKWYAHTVGEPDAAIMNRSVNTEDVTFKEDGTLIIHTQPRSGGQGQSFEAKWEYDEESGAIKSIFEMQGTTQTENISIKELARENLLLIFRNKSVGYKLVPQDPNHLPEEQIKKAPMSVESSNTINLDDWNGVYPFSQKLVYDTAGNSQAIASTGVIIMLKIDGKRILRVSDDGTETEYTVSGGMDIANEKHYGVETDNPDMAGEFVFRKDGSIYFYSDKDGATTDFK